MPLFSSSVTMVLLLIVVVQQSEGRTSGVRKRVHQAIAWWLVDTLPGAGGMGGMERISDAGGWGGQPKSPGGGGGAL